MHTVISDVYEERVVISRGRLSGPVLSRGEGGVSTGTGKGLRRAGCLSQTFVMAGAAH